MFSGAESANATRLIKHSQTHPAEEYDEVIQATGSRWKSVKKQLTMLEEHYYSE